MDTTGFKFTDIVRHYTPGKIEFNGLTINVAYDSNPGSPREDDNLGTMLCMHRRYTLGDENALDTLREAVRDSSAYRPGWEDTFDFDDGGALAHLAENRCGFVVLPIYMYDHSGITINTTGFSCPWDSGQLGIIFVSADDIRAEYSVKRISKQLRERVTGYLRAEVATYDQFLRGEVWGWFIEDSEELYIDSCWGYYDLKSVEADVKEAIGNFDE